MKDIAAFVLIFLCLVLICISVTAIYKENANLKNTDRVELPDGQGYYVKNAALTQKFVDSVPEGETILCYGGVVVNKSIRGKGVDKTIIRNTMSY